MSLSTDGSARSANSVRIAAVRRTVPGSSPTETDSIPFRTVRSQTGNPRGSS